MSSTRFAPPPPRPAVASPDLWRPDWTAGVPRDPLLQWLDKNENADPALTALVSRVTAEAATDAGGKALFTYAESGPLYRKLAARLGLEPAHLLLAAGSDGVIRSVFEAFVEPGDGVVHTAPTFAMYGVYSAMFGAREISLAYAPGSSGPVLNADTVCETIDRETPKLVCLPNPDSPTGTWFGARDLRRIVEAAGAAGALILIDEAYYPFHPETAIDWIGDYGHLVVARTFAKAWGMAGLRIGFAAAQPDVATLLHKVRPMYEVNTLAVAVAERMLDHEREVDASVARLVAGREGFVAAMRELGYPALSTGGNFLHVAFGEDAERVHQALAGRVLYRLDHAEPCLKGFTRFSATTPEAFEPIIDTIRHTVVASGRETSEHVR